MKLTIKQEKFCNLYIELGNASEAYRQSYNCEKMKPESVNNKAYEMLKKVEIGVRLDELRAKHAERHNINVDDLIKELELGLEKLLEFKDLKETKLKNYLCKEIAFIVKDLQLI